MNRSRVVSCMVLLFFAASAVLGIPAAASDPVQADLAGRPAAAQLDMPGVEVVESTEQGLLLDVQLGGLHSSEVELAGNVYQRLSLPYSGATTAVGKPELPTFGRFIALPQMGQVEVEILEATSEVIPDVLVYPAQEPQTDCALGEGSTPFVLDEDFYQEDTVYPGQVAAVAESKILRGCRVTVLGLYPLQYNPARRELTVYTHLRVRVRFVGAEGGFIDEQHRADSFEVLYSRLLLNYEQLGTPQARPAPTSPTGAEFLIITHPDFASAANDLAAWRNSQGIDTEVRTTTQTGSTAAEIQAYIQNAYDTWTPAPEFVLLVGDHEWIPTNYSGSTATDLYYFTVDGSDYYPDIHGGRIAVDTLAQAQKTITDIIDYDRSPVPDEAFYENVSMAAYFQDDEQDGYESRRFVRTSEDIRDYLLTEGYTVERIYVTESYINPTHYNNGYYGNGEPLPADLLRPGFAWDGDGADITAAVEAGRFILNHRDHGSYGGWGDPYYTVADVLALNNGNLLPVVFSMNCQSGGFDNAVDPCFAEAWQRTPNGGAVGVVAATRNSYSGYNDWMTLGFYDAIWPDILPEVIPGYDLPEYRMGVVLNYGKLIMEATWGDPWGYQELEFELFHYFGDPTMGIHTSPPFADFSLTVDPGVQNVCVPDTTAYTVTVGSILSYADPVSLTAYGAPSGSTIFLSPDLVTPPGVSTMTISNTVAAPAGYYSIDVVGTAPTSTHTATVGLNLFTDVPGAITLLSPPNGAVGVLLSPVYTWTAAAQAIDYYLEVATDVGFGNVVYSATVVGTSHESTVSLASTTLYYWRVRADNVCGTGSYSAIFSFQTAAVSCAVYDSTDVPKPIPEGGGSSGTTTSILDVALGGPILDVNVLNLVGTHTYMGDLSFYLDSPEGTQVQLMGQACGSADNFDLNLDDDAAPGPWPCPPTGGGTYQPTGSLSDLDGEDSTGTWTLSIVDGYAGDTGQLNSWSLEICFADSQCVSPTIMLLDSDSPVELGQPMAFTATVDGTAPFTYSWDLGGAGSGEGLDTAMPVYTYTDAGVYTVSLVVENDCGTDTDSIVVEVYCDAPDVVIASDSPVELGQPMQFSSTVSGTGPFTYSWDFGDGLGSSAEANPVYSYTDAGVYTVSLVVENDCGTDTDSIVVEVYCDAPDVAIASSSPVTLGLPMQFSSTVSGTGPFSYSWDLGDGLGSSTEANPVYTYTASGTYTVTLMVEGPCGSDEVSIVVEVLLPCEEPMVALESDSPVELGGAMQFTATVSGTEPLSYTWDLSGAGSGEGLDTAMPVYTYTDAGVYTVSLVVENDCGTDTDSIVVEVVVPCEEPAVALESDSPVELGGAMQFTATASGTEPLSYTWAFGGPGAGEGLDTATPVFTYTGYGTFSVVVTVTNDCGEDADGMVVEVLLPCEEPAAEIASSSPVTLGLPMQFTATVAGTGPFSYTWDFGDGLGSSAEANPVYTYTAGGTYTVTLTVEGACGSDEVSAVVVVEEEAVFRIYLPLVLSGSAGRVLDNIAP